MVGGEKKKWWWWWVVMMVVVVGGWVVAPGGWSGVCLCVVCDHCVRCFCFLFMSATVYEFFSFQFCQAMGMCAEVRATATFVGASLLWSVVRQKIRSSETPGVISRKKVWTDEKLPAAGKNDH